MWSDVVLPVLRQSSTFKILLLSEVYRGTCWN